MRCDILFSEVELEIELIVSETDLELQVIVSEMATELEMNARERAIDNEIIELRDDGFIRVLSYLPGISYYYSSNWFRD